MLDKTEDRINKSTTSYLAHLSPEGDRSQTVEEHLEGTAALSESFAASFCMAEQGKLIGLAHDVGKCSAEFQERLRGGKIVDHASAGAYECAKLDALWASCCIVGHHGGLPDFGNLINDTVDDTTVAGRIKRAHAGQIPNYELPIKLEPIADPPGFGQDDLTNSFITRMLYSCLVDADFLDTERFMSAGNTYRGAGDSLDLLLNKLNAYIEPWKNPTNELNKHRFGVLTSCISNGAAYERGIYTLTVPTGGGKTIASVAFALNHAVKNGMDRVIYVIPYTSIIEQTAAVFRDVFGDENVVEHHSNAVFEVGENGGTDQYYRIKATENWDAPIIVTTAVQFFESLYSNRSSKCRKLHNIANSVIIFDEAQMIPSIHLRPCVAAIANLVRYFRSTAVLCTATQPILNDLFTKYVPGVKITELCPGTDRLFSLFRRTTFKNAGQLDTDTLSSELASLPQVLCIVNSRKAAQTIYSKLPAEGSFHLSTLMYPAHRRSVLAEIRQRLKEGLPCRVVSTSLIEAGVDVDFPAVFRELAGLDSILQAAGRCNREGKHTPEESIVTIFEGASDTPQMLKVNIGATREALKNGADPALPDTVNHYFREYRDLFDSDINSRAIDKYGVISAFEKGLQGCRLPFRTVASQFHLIDDASKTVYIPRGEGAGLIKRLQKGEHTRELFRKLGQYGVSIYEKHYKNLLNAGFITPVDDESGILTDLKLYNNAMGLMLSPDFGTDIFV